MLFVAQRPFELFVSSLNDVRIPRGFSQTGPFCVTARRLITPGAGSAHQSPAASPGCWEESQPLCQALIAASSHGPSLGSLRRSVKPYQIASPAWRASSLVPGEENYSSFWGGSARAGGGGVKSQPPHPGSAGLGFSIFQGILGFS